MRIAVGVPTLSNFKGLAELFASLWGAEYTPFVVANWTENIGVSKAWNEILNATLDFDVTLICNDDVVFSREGLNNLVRSWEEAPADAIMLTASTVFDFEGPRYVPAPDYSCFAVRPQLYRDKIGLFDENFERGYFEDNDSHYRIKLAGYEAYRDHLSVITHKGSQTQNANPNNPVVPPEMFERNRSYFVRKWGGSPSEETFKNPYGDVSKDWKYWHGQNT
jgi:GT2 family glycosyltransferase